ncbi:DUF3224 domain-containing protein [Phycicoccus flavus]|uniref:DUF3224 domain-containing protein n=1 Tax=Phycicoccus flavus TaxID=2502783 RepID=UPI000FEBC74E|nr:DUF3224 domain-containing protein [Phycicoccus flavus]NHA69535.1 DUF3224 domain-containing protein [Phycicoccus flavus]
MTDTATGTFDITMTPVEHDQDGIGRMAFTKTWSGDLSGTGEGTMLTAGRPEEGRAGYVAVERVVGSLAGREGSFAFQQSGTMVDGEATQQYLVVPGSGTGDLAGLAGTLSLTQDAGGHAYRLEYDL